MSQNPCAPEPLQLQEHADSTDEARLPALRSNIRLYPAPRHTAGSPTWTLHDPVKSQFCRIGWLEFELLSRWSCGTVPALIESVNNHTTLQANEEHVLALLQMLKDNELLDCRDAAQAAQLQKHAQRPARAISSRLFTASLYARKKLFNPERFLTAADRFLQPLYQRKRVVLSLLAIMTIAASWSLIRHRFELHNTLSDYLSPAGFAGFILTLVVLNIIHEFGHGLAAKRYGCRVTEMGIAFIFMMPVAYCDTTDAWRLSSNRKRLIIDAGGLMMEAMLALFAIWAWLLLPDGMLRTLAFFVAVTSLATTLLINLNPFMKFDGYYLLADGLGMENLQTRAFSTLRWRIRKLTLGSQEAMPFLMSEHQRRIVQLYAASTWIYRFFLYLGIAWLVYQFWFKALGLMMMLAVLTVMIVKPVLGELTQMYRVVKDQISRRAIHGRTVFTAAAAMLLLLALIMPLPRTITAPAVMTSADTTQLFSPRPARIASIHVTHEQSVARGDVIAVLDSTELQYELATQQRQLLLLQAQQRQQADSSRVSSEQWIDHHDISSAVAAIAETQLRIDGLVLRSQSDGEVVRLDEWLKPGLWLPANTIVAEIADTHNTIVRAYVAEHEFNRLQPSDDTTPVFVSRTQDKPVALTISRVSQDNIELLTDPALTIANGGTIPARPLDDQWSPLQGWHIATLSPDTPVSLARELTGVVRFESTPVSLASRGVDRLYGALLRELSF